jgi:hypothetical protein
LAEEGVLGGAASFLGKEMKGAGNAALGLAGNLLSGSQSVGAYSEALKTNTKMLGTFGAAVDGLVKFAEQSLGEYQSLTRLGATFGASISDIKLAAAEMGMEVKEMTEFFQKNQSSMRSFGGTTEEAVQTFRGFSKSFLDDTAGFSNRLRMMGYTVGDINESLALYGELQEVDTLRNQMANRTANAAAFDMATQMDALAKLTGKQKDEIAAEMRERRRQGDIQAFLMGQSAEGAAAFQASTQELSATVGPQFASLIEDLTIRGAPISEANKAAYIALGEAAGEYDKLAGMYRDAERTGDFSAYNRQLSTVQAATIDRLKSEDAQQIAMLGGMNDMTQAFGQMYEQTFDFRRGVEGAAEGAQDLETVVNSMKATVMSQQEAQQTAQGLIRETVAMQEQVRTTVIAVQEEATKRLEQLATSAIKGIRDMMSETDFAGGVQDALNSIFTGAEDSLKSLIDPLGIFDQVTEAQVNADEVTVGEGTAAEAAQDLGAEIQTSANDLRDRLGDNIDDRTEATLSSIERLADSNNEADRVRAQEALDIMQGMETASADRAAAEAVLTEANAALNEAINSGVIPEIAAAQEAVNAAEDTLNTKIETETQILNDAIAAQSDMIKSSMEFTNNKIAAFQNNPSNFMGGFDSGGNIPSGSFGMVGEYGPEFINGPANVMSRLRSRDLLASMRDQLVRENNTQTTTEAAASGSNPDFANQLSKGFGELAARLDTIAAVGTQQLNVGNKQLRTQKGLSGNMMKGINVS